MVKDTADLHEISFQSNLRNGRVRKSECAPKLNCNDSGSVNGDLHIDFCLVKKSRSQQCLLNS